MLTQRQPPHPALRPSGGRVQGDAAPLWPSEEAPPVSACVKVKVAQSVTPWTVALPGSPVRAILQTRILEWPVPSPGDLPDSGIEPPGLLHCRQILYRLSQQGSPRIPLKFSTLSLSAHSRCEGGRSIFGSPPMAHPDLWLNPIPSLVAMETGWKKDAGLLLCVWGDVWQYLGACTMPTLGAKR